MADLETLSVSLGARIDDFKKGMQEAVREFDKDAGAIERRNLELTESLDRNMKKGAASAYFLAGALKGLFSVYAIQQFISKAVDANIEIAKMARSADLARVSLQKFQEIQFASKTLGGASPEDVQRSAHDLALRVNSELREGEGELTNLLKANNQSLTDRNGKAKDFNQLLMIAADLLQRSKDEAQAIDIGRLFNLSEEMVRALEKGPAAFKRAQEAAKAAGAVLDEDVVQKAKEFDHLWNESWSRFATYARSAAVDALAALAPVGTWLENTFKNLPGYLKAVSAGINATEGGGGPGTGAETPEQEARRLLARASAIPINTARVFGTTTGQQFGPNLPGPPVVPKRGGGGEAGDEFDREEKRITKQTNALAGQAAAIGKLGEASGIAEAKARLLIAAQEAGRKITPALTLEIDKLAEKYGKLKSSVEAAKLEQDAIFERQQIGRTADEQQIASRTRGLGADDAERLGNQLRENQRLLEGKEMASSFVKGLVSDLENGVKAGKALENQLKRIAEKLTDKGIDALISALFSGFTGGSGGGIFGGVFSAATHSVGGWAGQGPRTMVPASAFIGAQQFAAGGGIPAILHAGEIVLNQAQQKNVAGGLRGAGPINLTHAPVINGTGLSKDEVFSVIQRSQKDFARQIGPVFNDWQRRYAK